MADREAIDAATDAVRDQLGVLRRPLVVVTGKGGVGKTTVAAAIALAGARGAVVCGEDESPIASLVDTLDLAPERALDEWLSQRAGGAAAGLLRRSRAFTYFVAAAPGAAELVTIGKVVDLAQRRGAVIFDAPATGHALAMLAAPRTFAAIARLGPVAGDAAGVLTRLQDPQFTAYVGVTAPEEMAVAELQTLECGLPEAVGHGLDLVIVNGVHPRRFSDEEAERMRALAVRAPGVLDAVLAEHERARREALQARRVRDLVAAPVVTVPYAFPQPALALR